MEDVHSRKAQLKTYSNHTFAFYQEGEILHNILWYLLLYFFFPIGEIVILRSDSCLIKNKMVKDTESVCSCDAIRIGVFCHNP